MFMSCIICAGSMYAQPIMVMGVFDCFRNAFCVLGIINNTWGGEVDSTKTNRISVLEDFY